MRWEMTVSAAQDNSRFVLVSGSCGAMLARRSSGSHMHVGPGLCRTQRNL